MSTVHPTISLRRLTKVMTLAEIARAVDCNLTTLDRSMKSERQSEFPQQDCRRLQQLLRTNK